MRKILLLIVIGALSFNTINAETKDSSRVVSKVLPRFQGGTHNDFAKWVTLQLKYPEDAYRQRREGRVVVSFVIEKDGSLTDVDVVESTADVFSREVIRVVMLSPKWTPGVKNGKIASGTIHIPVSFKLDRRALGKSKREIAKRDRRN